MSLYTLTFSSLLALGLAQSTTVSLLIPNAGNVTGLVGSIAGQDSTATTFVVQCNSSASTAMPSAAMTTSAMITGAPDVNDIESEGDDEEGDCPFLKPQTVVQGPSTLHFVEAENDLSNTIDCQLMGTTKAVCSGTLSGVEPSDTAETVPGVATETATLSGSDLPSFIPVIITAGVSNSASASQTSPTSGTSSGTRSPSTGTSVSSGSTTATAANSQSTGSAGGRSMEPALGVAAAGVMALGVVAAVL